jgi:hypothetical protein
LFHQFENVTTSSILWLVVFFNSQTWLHRCKRITFQPHLLTLLQSLVASPTCSIHWVSYHYSIEGSTRVLRFWSPKEFPCKTVSDFYMFSSGLILLRFFTSVWLQHSLPGHVWLTGWTCGAGDYFTICDDTDFALFFECHDLFSDCHGSSQVLYDGPWRKGFSAWWRSPSDSLHQRWCALN